MFVVVDVVIMLFLELVPDVWVLLTPADTLRFVKPAFALLEMVEEFEPELLVVPCVLDVVVEVVID